MSLILLATVGAITAAQSQSQLNSATITRYIPAHFHLVETHTVDLDGDGRPDRVLVIQDSRDQTGKRTLLILRATPTGFRLDARSDRLMLCEQCGGVYGDPLASINVSRKTIVINHYGGSNWRWGISQAFTLTSNGWQLSKLDKFVSNPYHKDDEYSIPPSECQNISLERYVCGTDYSKTITVRSHRAYFYHSPARNDRTKRYIVAGQEFIVYQLFKNFAWGAYESETGQLTEGFIRLVDLQLHKES